MQSQPNNNPFLLIKGITKEYSYVPALKDVSMNIDKGSFTALLGPNGAGKTTLMKIICGLVSPGKGTVNISGRNITSTGCSSGIGLLSHESLLYGNLSAIQNLKFYLSLYGKDNPDSRALELLERVGLTRRADDAVRGFSRGMKQRLSIARALVNDPELLLLDEPYTGLDQDGKLVLRETLRDLCAEGKTIIMTTHDFIEVMELASHIAVLKKGSLKLFRECGEKSLKELETSYREAVA